MREAVVVAVFLTLSGLAVAGKAEDAKKAEARARFEDGSKYYNLRDYEKALTEFRTVYLLTGQPSLLLNIGQRERQLKKYEDARKSFQAYLREANPGEQQALEVRKLITGVETAIKEDEEKRAADAALRAAAEQPKPPPRQEATPPPAIVAEVAVSSPPPPRKRTRPWVWGVVGASVVVVAGVAVGLGIGLTAHPKYPSPTEGTVHGN